MLAIVDAFDSMTSEQVYRPAMSREPALHELFEKAGTQFDPDLVKSFSELNIGAHLHQKVMSHWLKTLDLRKANQFWRNTPAALLTEPAVPTESLFQQKLLDNMFDAVVFVDCNMRIMKWNRGAERLTGLSSDSVLHRNWSPSLIGLSDEQNGELLGVECPIAYCVSTGVQSLRRLIASTDDKSIAVDVHTVPLSDPTELPMVRRCCCTTPLHKHRSRNNAIACMNALRRIHLRRWPTRRVRRARTICSSMPISNVMSLAA